MQCALAVDLADSYYVGEKEEELVFTKTRRKTQKIREAVQALSSWLPVAK